MFLSTVALQDFADDMASCECLVVQKGNDFDANNLWVKEDLLMIIIIMLGGRVIKQTGHKQHIKEARRFLSLLASHHLWQPRALPVIL